MAKYVMFQGTSSHVGKSILTAAICRILFQDGVKVAPFKAQNMALNSYVTKDGKEMGRAQVVQAEAAGLEPEIEMNPVLLKPTSNEASQVVVMGKPLTDMTAGDYHKGRSLLLWDKVVSALEVLDKKYEAVVIEGAGSPAEVNLKKNDIVNMKVACHLKAPVLLIADIDRGGALASLVGTLELLEPEERDLVKGLIINKFYGDNSLLAPAVDFLEKKTGKPVLGIIPHIRNIGIDDEDSVSLDEREERPRSNDIAIAVLRTPRISNYTDFDCLASESDVSLYYVDSVEALGKPDLIIIPGSKNTTEDLMELREAGLAAKVKEMTDVPVIGICGGYQMLGEEILDPHHTESKYDGVRGLGLLQIKTTFSEEKTTSQVEVVCKGFEFAGQPVTAGSLRGYEIHMGETEFTGDSDSHPLCITKRSQEACDQIEGTVRSDGMVFGTYIHGIFDNDDFRRSIINALRVRKGLTPLKNTRNVFAEKQRSYNALADVVRSNLDIDRLKQIMGLTE